METATACGRKCSHLPFSSPCPSDLSSVSASRKAAKRSSCFKALFVFARFSYALPLRAAFAAKRCRKLPPASSR